MVDNIGTVLVALAKVRAATSPNAVLPSWISDILVSYLYYKLWGLSQSPDWNDCWKSLFLLLKAGASCLFKGYACA